MVEGLNWCIDWDFDLLCTIVEANKNFYKCSYHRIVFLLLLVISLIRIVILFKAILRIHELYMFKIIKKY